MPTPSGIDFMQKNTPPPPYPLVFLGSQDFSDHCLRAVLNSPLFQVQALITRERRAGGRRGLKLKKTPVAETGRTANLPVYHLKSFCESDFSARLFQNPSLLAAAVGYGRILPPEFLKSFRHRAFNIHPSLLPLYRGAAPVERAVMDGASISGVSLQRISEKLDEGDLIGQKRFSILPDDTAGDVYEKAKTASIQLLLQDLPLFLQGKISPRPQPQIRNLSYAKKIQKEECRIIWKNSALRIHNQIRGLSPKPGAFAFFKGKRLKIYRSQVFRGGGNEIKNIKSGNDGVPPQAEHSTGFPGKILACSKKFFVIACGKGALSVMEVQMEGRKKLSAQEFLKGAGFTADGRLL